MSGRLWLLLLGLAAVFGLGLGAGRMSLIPALRRDQAALQQAQAQAAAAAATTRVVERTVVRERVLARQTETEAHALQTLPDAQTPLPDDVRDHWRDALLRLRAQE